MPQFVRLAPEQLEARDTPSLPQLELYGGVLPIPVPMSTAPVEVAPARPIAPARPSAPAPEPVGFWERASLDCVVGVWGATHTVYKFPLMWPMLPR